jgi:hypothetical protein
MGRLCLFDVFARFCPLLPAFLAFNSHATGWMKADFFAKGTTIL